MNGIEKFIEVMTNWQRAYWERRTIFIDPMSNTEVMVMASEYKNDSRELAYTIETQVTTPITVEDGEAAAGAIIARIALSS